MYHGEEDHTVEFSVAVDTAEAMLDLGIDVEYKWHRGEGHSNFGGDIPDLLFPYLFAHVASGDCCPTENMDVPALPLP